MTNKDKKFRGKSVKRPMVKYFLILFIFAVFSLLSVFSDDNICGKQSVDIKNSSFVARASRFLIHNSAFEAFACTPYPAKLLLSHIECVGESKIEVHFVANQLPSIVDDYGTVHYTLNSINYDAFFDKRTGDTAHYFDYLAGDIGEYNVTAAWVEIDGNRVELNNPQSIEVICVTPTPTPTPTPTGCTGNCGVILIVTEPRITVVKNANPPVLPPIGGSVVYGYQVYNPGSGFLTDVVLTDDKCSPVKYTGGDLNNDRKLDRGEIWKYNCQADVNRTTVNTATATGKFEAKVLTATASAMVTVGALSPNDPVIGLVKKAVPPILPYDGGVVNYVYTVTNPGIVPLTDTTLVDDNCSPVNYVEGDTNKDNKLDTTETWTYLCRKFVTVNTTNSSNVAGKYGDKIAADHAVVAVIVEPPPVIPKKFPKTGNGSGLDNSGLVWFLSSSAAAFVSIKIILKTWRKYRYTA